MTSPKVFHKGKQITLDKPCRLNYAQFFKITEMLRGELREWLMHENPSYVEVAKRLSELVDFPLIPAHISNANGQVQVWEPKMSRSMKEYHNLRERFDEIKKDLTSSVAKNIDDLRKSLVETCNKQAVEISHLRMLVSHIYHEMDLKPPFGVQIPPRNNAENRIPVVNK